MSRFTGNTCPRLGLAVACVAQFVVVLDATIVTTALPSIASDLNLSTGQVQWVLTAYTLVFGGFLISGGRLSDLLGARRAFLVGLALFVVASAACGLAVSGPMLIGARVVQGLGAALLSPAALALLVTLTKEGQARRTAIGAWTATAAVGGGSGWVLGGLLTQYWGWPAVFWLNLPIGIVALLAAPGLLPRTRPIGGRSLDLVGAIGLTAALGCLGYALAEAANRGLTSVVTFGPGAIAGLLLFLTLGYEARHPAPLLPARLLRSRPLVVGGLSAALLTGTTSPAMLLSVLYARRVVGHSPAGAALLFPAFNVGVIGGSVLSSHLIRRWGTRIPLVAGFGFVFTGVTLLVGLPEQVSSRFGADLQLVIAFVATGFGLGVASVASTQVGTESVRSADRGVGAGVLNSAAQVGAALGMALLLPLASANPGGAGGYRVGYLCCCGVALAGAAIGLFSSRRPGRLVGG